MKLGDLDVEGAHAVLDEAVGHAGGDVAPVELALQLLPIAAAVADGRLVRATDVEDGRVIPEKVGALACAPLFDVVAGFGRVAAIVRGATDSASNLLLIES